MDGFQGQEAEVVLFCCVRTASGGRIGFLSDLRRQNVALTRAKHSLVVFARAEALRGHVDWKPFVDHLERNDRVLNTGSLSMQEVRTRQYMRDTAVRHTSLIIYLFITSQAMKSIEAVSPDPTPFMGNRDDYFAKVCLMNTN